MSYTDTETGEEIEGKAFILKSTDGEEVVDPARLFAGAADQEKTAQLAEELAALTDRVQALEADATAPEAPADETPGD